MKKLSLFLLVLIILVPSLWALSSPFTVAIGSDIILTGSASDTYFTGFLDLGTIAGGRNSGNSFTLDFRTDLGFNVIAPAALFKFTLFSGVTFDFDGDYYIDLLPSFAMKVIIDGGNNEELDYCPGFTLNFGSNLSDDGILAPYIGFGIEYFIVKRRPSFNVLCGFKMGL